MISLVFMPYIHVLSEVWRYIWHMLS